MANKNALNYKLIIINGIWQYHNYVAWKIAKKFNIPYFIFPHGMLDPWFNENYFFIISKNKKIKFSLLQLFLVLFVKFFDID